jgi:hypothetical protein
MTFFRAVAAALTALVLAGRPLPAHAAAPVAVLLSDPGLPGDDPALTALATRAVHAAGYAVTAEPTDALLRPGALDRDHCALLVLPRAGALPPPLFPALTAYLKAGGQLIALGSPILAAPLTRRADGGWVTTAALAQLLALTPPAHPTFSFETPADLTGWQRTTSAPTLPTRTVSEDAATNGKTARTLHVTITDLQGYDTFLSPVLASSPFGTDRTITVFSARGGPRTHSLAIEWDERDGSRWIATVPVTPEWRHYALPPSAFQPWAMPAARATAGFHPENATRFSVGMAFSHTGPSGGAHEYWISGIGTGAGNEPDAVLPATADLPPIDGLAPAYKFFPLHGAVRLGGTGAPILAGLGSFQPRPAGSGYAKGRPWRSITLLGAEDASTGEWRGAPGSLLIHAPGTSSDAAVPFGYPGGAIASFAFSDLALYRRADVQDAITVAARRLREGRFLLEGGSEFYTYFPGQAVRAGARLVDLRQSGPTQASALRITVRDAEKRTLWTVTWPVTSGAGAVVTREAEWTPPTNALAGGGQVTTELVAGERVLDRIDHDIATWSPPTKPNWITKRADGHFYENGALWRANGINYMPSSGIACENGHFYEDWLSRESYDAAIIERDLTHIEALGFNAISVFVYADTTPSQNLLDLLRRCRAHHLRVNLSLRPGVLTFVHSVGPERASDEVWKGFERIVRAFRIPENDTVFAYEIDWEPGLTDQADRRMLDPGWREWVAKRYGTIDDAVRAWGVPAPRDAQGLLSNPAGPQIQEDAGGPDVRMVADYRHYLDDWLAEQYGDPIRRLHTLDPRHLVSFRMASAGSPVDYGGEIPYQFEGLARVVDFLSPESYGRIGTPEKDGTNVFELAYARAAAPTLPVIWAETGLTIWDRGLMADTPDGLLAQGDYYRRFYELSRTSGADGIFWWWYAGGFRVGENSDYGVVEPDGTDRPATVVIRREGPLFLHASPPPKPDVFLPYNRDDYPDAARGIYLHVRGPFFDALAHGKHPALRPVAKP